MTRKGKFGPSFPDRVRWAALPLILLCLGLLPAGCGGKKEEKARPRSGWEVLLGPRVRGALEGLGRPKLKAWGPWWVPLWERTIGGGKTPDRAFRFQAPAPSDSLAWITLEAGGKILCGALVRGGVENFPYRIEIREVRVRLEEAGLPPGKLRPLEDPRAGRVPLGFPAGGLGRDLSAETALWAFTSPDLDLRSWWLVPRVGPGGTYCFLQADCRSDPGDWGGPSQEWGLDGEKARRLRGRFPPGLRIFSAGFRFKPWRGPEGVPGNPLKASFREGLSFWSPGWDCRPGRKDALLVGHSDWRRLFLLLPQDKGWGLFPLWPAEPYRGLKEDPPEAVWRLSWKRKGKRFVSFQAYGIPPGLPFAAEGKSWNWAVLVIHESGGMGKGFSCGGTELRVRLSKEGGPRPFVLLETPMFKGSKAKGLVFWDPRFKARLAWGKERDALLSHKATLVFRPGPEGPQVEARLR